MERSWLTIFVGEELDRVTEVAGHAAVEHTDTCRHPGVRPETSGRRSQLPVVTATRRRVLAELRQRRTEQYRRTITEDDLFTVLHAWIISLPELQLHMQSTIHQ